MPPRKVAVIGLGLMGGSLGLAIRHFCPEIEITGADKSVQALEEARRRRAVHRTTPDWREAVGDADIVFIATPIHAILTLLGKIGSKIGPDTLVTDLGSTKAEICKAAQKFIPGRFIGGHPMTGSEIQGIKAADPYLFENAVYLLTPENPKDKNLPPLARFIQRLGASVITVSPRAHDEVAAAASHLPQLLAVALAAVTARKNAKEPLVRELAAGGFRDMTRIASSPYSVWRDILQSNSAPVRRALDEFIRELQSLRRETGKNSLGKTFKKAAGFRRKLPAKRKGFLRSLHRIAVSVKDEPGSLARLTGVLSQAGLNVSDIELLKVREGIGGTFQLYFASDQDAEKAAGVLSQAGWDSRVID